MAREVQEISSNPGHNEQLDRSIEGIRAVYDEAEKLSNDLEKVRNDGHSHPADFSQLLAAKPVFYDEFQRSLYDYSNALIVYRHFVSDAGQHRGLLAKVVDAEKRHLMQAKYQFGKWIDECDEHIRTARRSLEK